MPDPNFALLQEAATKLGPLLNEVVFIGGVTLGLLMTDDRRKLPPLYERGWTESWRYLLDLVCATFDLLHLLALGYALADGGVRRSRRIPSSA